MSRVFRAQDVPAGERLDHWRDAVAAAGLGVQGRARPPAPGAGFNAWLRVGEIGAVRVVQASSPPGECLRSTALSRQADPDHALCRAGADSDVVGVPTRSTPRSLSS